MPELTTYINEAGEFFATKTESHQRIMRMAELLLQIDKLQKENAMLKDEIEALSNIEE